MPCAEVANAIAWSKQNTATKTFPVVAYFTKQFGYNEPVPGHIDAVFYASGEVAASDKTATAHLKGSLMVAKNTEQAGEMRERADLAFDIEIFPDLTVTYLMRINGSPVGGLPPTKVQ